MLAQKNRFHGHASLSYVYRNGAVSRSRLFIVRATVNTRRKHPRYSVVVSKKVLKSAVGRNRIRRRTYHIAQEDIAQLQKSWDVVITVCSAEVRTLDHATIHAQLKAQLQELDIIPS